MTDTAPESDATETLVEPDKGETPDLAAEVEKWKSLARKHEDRAKTYAQSVKELDQLKQASMSDLEKAVAQAKVEGRTEAAQQFGSKLASAEVRAAAAGRLTDQQVAVLLEGLNLTAFLTEDGEVDRKQVAKFVDGIAPAGQENRTNGFPDLGQGARGGPSGMGDMNTLIRRSAGRT